MAPRPLKFTDEQIREILTADKGTDWSLWAKTLGVSLRCLRLHRDRKTRASIRIAIEMGLIAPMAPRRVYRAGREEVVAGTFARASATQTLPGIRYKRA